ncbi:hypothetical protein AWENTII_003358 [Aspergillus wentii]|nr:hypothetical protein MW887_011975 [Aspergillus wentii]
MKLATILSAFLATGLVSAIPVDVDADIKDVASKNDINLRDHVVPEVKHEDIFGKGDKVPGHKGKHEDVHGHDGEKDGHKDGHKDEHKDEHKGHDGKKGHDEHH